MPSASDLLTSLRAGRAALNWRDPATFMRAILGVLLAGNLIAALLLFRPWGGSAEELAARLEQLQREAAPKQAALARARALADKVESARTQGDRFLETYTLPRRTAFSTIVAEMDQSAARAGLKPKERTFLVDPIEGSETLSMMTITAAYEGNYADLQKFLNALDRSPRFLIIESLQAAPQPAGVLNIGIKVNLFVREAAGGSTS